MPDTYSPEMPVTLTINIRRYSAGRSSHDRYRDGTLPAVGNIGYRCLGLKYGAYLIPVKPWTAPGSLSLTSTTHQFYVSTSLVCPSGRFSPRSSRSMREPLRQSESPALNVSESDVVNGVPPEPVYLTGNASADPDRRFTTGLVRDPYALYHGCLGDPNY